VARECVGGADEDAVGVEKIVYGCACSEELGVGKDFEGEVWTVDFELQKGRISVEFLGVELLNLQCLE
jgi:hypothetical protein